MGILSWISQIGPMELQGFLQGKEGDWRVREGDAMQEAEGWVVCEREI